MECRTLIVFPYCVLLFIRMACTLSLTQDPKQICNRTYFEKNYVSNNMYANLASMNRTCASFFQNNSCKGVFEAHYTIVEADLRELPQEDYSFLVCVTNYTHFNHSTYNQASGCWGIVLEYGEANSKYEHKTLYNKYTTNELFPCWKIPYALKIRYLFRIGTLPIGKRIEFNWTSPGFCDIDTVKVIYDKLGGTANHNCLGVNSRLKFASKVCKEIKDDEARREYLRKYVEMENCTLVFRNRTLNVQNNHLTSIVVISVVSVLVTGAFVLLILRWRLKKRDYGIYGLRDSSMENENQKKKVRSRPSVMILNRPGCELLESFLRDFSFILKSYEIDVKLALLEQNEVDSQGGIASYMQRYIDTCDYILIMFSENDNVSSSITKHRPYEFALHVIGGLAYHQNCVTRYIPIYLTSYRKIVRVLPSFLNATTSFGYQLPKDTEKLLKRILGKNGLPKCKERDFRDKFLKDKLKEQTKRILEKKHPNCINDTCINGQSYSSFQNLSSIWPSTVHSKWHSKNFLPEEHKENEDEKISFQELLDYKIQNLLCDKENNSDQDESNHFLHPQLSASSSIICNN